MTASVPISELIQRLSPGAKVELFELDLSPITGTNTEFDHVYFHAGTNDLGEPVVWQGKTYNPFAVRADGFEKTTKGQSPRPKISVANIQSAITALMTEHDDLLGARLIRRRTYARFLDAVNFPERVNLIKFSEEFNQWATLGSRIVTNVTHTPYGELSADKLVESSLNEAHSVTSQNFNLSASTLYTGSISVLPVERRKVRVQLQGTAFGTSRFAVVDLISGQVTQTGGLDSPELGDLVTVEKQHSGWTRIHITTRTAVANTAQLKVWTTNTGGALTYQGDGTSGVIVASAQINAGGIAKYEYQGSTWSRNPDADPDQHLPDEVWIVERKMNEEPQQVDLELASPMDLEGSVLPSRFITADYCGWEYRGPECGYSGTDYFDAFDRPVDTLEEDVCSQASSGCKCRFGSGLLPFGGFKAVRVYRS